MSAGGDLVLRCREPDLEERRGGRTLLVWGELPQWLVVDRELAEFMARFDGQHTLSEVLQRHARETGQSLSTVVQQALPLVDTLRHKAILAPPGHRVTHEPEALSIANVTVNLTNRCNLRCPFCYNEERATDEYPVADLMDRLEEALPLLARQASFIILGGEPFLTPDRTLEAVRRAEQIFAPPTMISTNGTLLTDELADHLASLRVEVQVSLDGATAPDHDALRGPGVFDKAVAGVRRLVEAGVPTLVSTVYTADTIDRFEPMLELARELGVREARFIPLRRIGKGAACAAQAPDQFVAFRHLLDVLQRRPEFRSLLQRDYFSINMAICRHAVARTGCGIGRKVLFVDADGTLYPCPNHVSPELAAGHLREQSVAAIVRRSPVFEDLRERYQVERYTVCRTCPFRFWCAGDCRGEVLSVTGNAAAPSPHCRELRRVYAEMCWLMAANDQRLGMAREVGHSQRVEDLFQV